MIKNPLTILFAFLVSFSAVAGSYIKTQEDYILATPEEQREYVIKVMELIVSIESQYQHEVTKHGYDQKRFEKYTSLLQKLSSELFIGSAYAAGITGNLDRELARKRDIDNHIITIPQTTVIPPSQKDSIKIGASSASSSSKNACGDKGFAKKNSMNSWESFAKAFANTRKAKSDYCMFAGWISRTSVVGNETVCNHPDYLSGSGSDRNKKCALPLETLNYPDPDLKDSDCVSKNGKRTIQCNPAIFGFKSKDKQSLFCVEASDGAHNSALSCMRKALADPAVPGADTKETRLKYLQEKLKDPKNKQLFENVQEFVYETCICDSPKDKFSKGYHDYIKDHRTCYGMMKMMADTLNCEVDNRPLKDNSLFQELIKFSVDHQLQTKSENAIDNEYKLFRDQVRQENSTEYKRVCGDSGSPTKPQQQSTETPKDETSCKAECKPSDKAAEGGKKQLNCSIKVEYAQEQGKPKKEALSLTKDFALEDNATKLTLDKATAKTDKDLQCDVTYPQETGEYECRKAECETDSSNPDDHKYSCKLTVGKKGEKDPLPDPITYTQKEKSEGSFEASLPILKGKPDFKVNCSDVTYKDEPKTEDFDFVITPKCKDKSCDVELSPAKKEDNTDGWSVEWSIKEKDLPKDVKEGWKDKPKESKTLESAVSHGGEDQQGEEQTQTPPAQQARLSITQERSSKNYTVVAKVTKNGKTKEKTATIPALGGPGKPVGPVTPARGVAGPGIMPPPVMIRPMNSGIYQGVK